MINIVVTYILIAYVSVLSAAGLENKKNAHNKVEFTVLTPALAAHLNVRIPNYEDDEMEELWSICNREYDANELAKKEARKREKKARRAVAAKQKRKKYRKR